MPLGQSPEQKFVKILLDMTTCGKFYQNDFNREKMDKLRKDLHTLRLKNPELRGKIGKSNILRMFGFDVQPNGGFYQVYWDNDFLVSF
jgi:hypothetical protein